jgi:DNA polymerase-3 subunit theta
MHVKTCQRAHHAVPSAVTRKEDSMNYNLADLPQDEMDKINVDLAAAGVAFKERYNMPVIAEVVEREQPENLRNWFRERLIAHRLASISLSRLPYEPKVK